MTYIKIVASGRPQIMTKEALITIRGGQLPSNNEEYSALLNSVGDKIKAQHNISREALNKTRGNWYEWILAVRAWNMCAADKSLNLAIKLPNISNYGISDLYVDDVRDIIEDFRNKVQLSSGVSFVSSNPDFVIISRNLVDSVMKIKPIKTFSDSTISRLDTAYQEFSKKCKFDDLVGYISSKISFRPDRRLQIAHEGSLMKALYVHVQTRNWIINPPGLRYYAIAASVGKADRKALKTVATHSIATVSSSPQRAVDDVFEINSNEQAMQALTKMLSP